MGYFSSYKLNQSMTEDYITNWVDLHLHTDKSDGTCTPSELIKLAAQQNIETIAITDHDTIDGLEEGINEGRKNNINVIPGIEISSKYTTGTLHILGYGIDYRAQRFLDELKRFQEVRKSRNVKIIARLQSLGIDISIADMMRNNPKIKSLGRPHIASVLVEMGVVCNMDEAFDEYLGNKGKAFISKEVLTSAETIQLIHNVGGLAFLAHPSTLNLVDKSFTAFIEKLLEEGLDGIEVYSSAHDEDQTLFYRDTAKRYDLLVSAGSDFHGSNKKDVVLGCCWIGGQASSEMVSQQLLGLFAGN